MNSGARFGTSFFLIALGAILSFAVKNTLTTAIDLVMIGYILMAVGAALLVVSVFLAAPKKDHRVAESRSVVDPNTGETITRNETEGRL